ncbi:hypothetical protein [Rossellomorea vietnamensis]
MRHDEVRLSVSYVEDRLIGKGIAETIQEMVNEWQRGMIWK